MANLGLPSGFFIFKKSFLSPGSRARIKGVMATQIALVLTWVS